MSVALVEMRDILMSKITEFILKNIDVELQKTNEEIEISMKYSDIESIKTNMRKISRCLFKIVR